METESGLALSRAARDHTRKVVEPQLTSWIAGGRFPRDAFADAAARGLCGLYAPREHGGQDASVAEAAGVFEELARGDGPYALAVSVHNFVTMAVAGAPDQAIAARFAEPMCRGELMGSFLLTEEGGGSDPVGTMRTVAARDGDGFRLTGTKAWASLVGEAELYAVVARHAEAPANSRDMSMFLVRLDDPGVRVGRRYDVAAGEYLPIGELVFDAVPLGPERLLAPVGEGLRSALSTIDIARVHIASSAVGLAAAALDLALLDARDRKLFGTGVLDLQANLFALADVATSIEAGRLLYRNAATLIGQPGGSVAAAHAKRFCPDAAVEAAVTCARVMGARGNLNDRRLPRILAAAQHLTMADGASEVQRLLIGRKLIRHAESLPPGAGPSA